MVARIRTIMVKIEEKKIDSRTIERHHHSQYLALDWMCGVMKGKESKQQRFLT